MSNLVQRFNEFFSEATRWHEISEIIKVTREALAFLEKMETPPQQEEKENSYQEEKENE